MWILISSTRHWFLWKFSSVSRFFHFLGIFSFLSGRTINVHLILSSQRFSSSTHLALLMSCVIISPLSLSHTHTHTHTHPHPRTHTPTHTHTYCHWKEMKCILGQLNTCVLGIVGLFHNAIVSTMICFRSMHPWKDFLFFIPLPHSIWFSVPFLPLLLLFLEIYWAKTILYPNVFLDTTNPGILKSSINSYIFLLPKNSWNQNLGSQQANNRFSVFKPQLRQLQFNPWP
jgi:hypothetical protein